MRKARFQAQGLIFGGLMTALVVIFAAVPFLTFFLPLPIVMVYLRHGGRVAVLTAAVSTIFTMLMLPPTVVLITVLPVGILPGLAMGLAYTRRWKPFLAGALVASFFFLGVAGDYALTRVTTFGGRDPLVAMMETEPLRSKVSSAVDDAVKQLTKTEPKTEAERETQAKMVARLEEVRQNPAPLIWTFLPMLLAAASAFFAWAHLLITAKLLPRFGFTPPPTTPFGELKLPVWVTLVFFGGQLGLQLAIQRFPTIPWWLDVVQAVLLGFMFLIMVAGLSVAYGWLRRRGIAKGLAILLALSGVVLLNQWVVILTMWDAIFDFRGLGRGIDRQPRSES